jgi:hypothetical protein
MNYLTLAVNLKNLATSQYVNYDFNSFATISGVAIGFSQDGIFELDNTKTDAGTAIDAFAELVNSDWGIPNLKRCRRIHVGYEAEGGINLILTTDEGYEESYSLKPVLAEEQQGGSVICARRSQKGRYWKVKVENIKGGDFSLDSITVDPTILSK